MPLAAMLLFGCERRGPPPQAYRHLDDKLIAAFGLNGLFWPCTHREETQYGVIYSSTPPDDCYVMLPPERVRGVWFDEFEGTRFFPNAVKPPADPYADRNYLDLRYEGESKPPVLHYRDNGRMVLIDIVGRRTAFGTSGFGRRPIFVVDKVLAERVIRPGRGDPGGPPAK